MIENLSDDNFQSYIDKAKIPLVIDFWAPFCGPCRLLSPILEGVSEKFHGEVLVSKINVEESPEAASWHKIRHLPTLVFVQNGCEKARLVGLQTHESLLSWITQNLS